MWENAQEDVLEIYFQKFLLKLFLKRIFYVSQWQKKEKKKRSRKCVLLGFATNRLMPYSWVRIPFGNCSLNFTLLLQINRFLEFHHLGWKLRCLRLNLHFAFRFHRKSPTWSFFLALYAGTLEFIKLLKCKSPAPHLFLSGHLLVSMLPRNKKLHF